MRTTPMSRIVPGLLLLGLLAVACSDRSSPVDPDGIAPPEAASFAHGPACDLTQGIRSDVRDYFPNGSTERQVANGLAQDLQKACSDAGDQNQVTDLATQLLGMVEDILDDGRGGSATVGSRLANRLLACTDSPCSSAHVPGLQLVPAMSQYGLFAVRGDDMEPAVAREAFPFIDVEEKANSALWGVEVEEDWSEIMGENPVLVYGAPTGGDGQDVNDIAFGSIAFDLDRWPGEGDFDVDDKLHVGVCFEHGIEETSDEDLLERVQRNSTLLTPHQPDFHEWCSSNGTQSALSRAGSMLASVAAFARNLVVEPLMAMIRDHPGVSSVGGSPQSFSEFTAVAADPQGTLELVKGPNPVVVVGQDIGEIQVRALSGSGTPVERVRVVLSVDNNSGAPAGAFLTGDTEAFTSEEDGIATFESVQVNKAGGYIVCATGTLAGFTFEPVCTEQFHARNN
jgi:hypothetical protein